jgi:hypothetical protein
MFCSADAFVRLHMGVASIEAQVMVYHKLIMVDTSRQMMKQHILQVNSNNQSQPGYSKQKATNL